MVHLWEPSRAALNVALTVHWLVGLKAVRWDFLFADYRAVHSAVHLVVFRADFNVDWFVVV